MIFTLKKHTSYLRYLLISLGLIVLISCKNNSTIEAPKREIKNTNPVDTLIIKHAAVIFIEPDSTKIEKLKQTHGEDAFYEGANDYLHYLTNADDFCKAEGMPTYFVTNKKVVHFISSDNKSSYLNIEELSNPWGVCIFHPTKEYKLIEVSLFEEEYQYYFHAN